MEVGRGHLKNNLWVYDLSRNAGSPNKVCQLRVVVRSGGLVGSG